MGRGRRTYVGKTESRRWNLLRHLYHFLTEGGDESAHVMIMYEDTRTVPRRCDWTV